MGVGTEEKRRKSGPEEEDYLNTENAKETKTHLAVLVDFQEN
jgi:hypothetical protein